MEDSLSLDIILLPAAHLCHQPLDRDWPRVQLVYTAKQPGSYEPNKKKRDSISYNNTQGIPFHSLCRRGLQVKENQPH